MTISLSMLALFIIIIFVIFTGASVVIMSANHSDNAWLLFKISILFLLIGFFIVFVLMGITTSYGTVTSQKYDIEKTQGAKLYFHDENNEEHTIELDGTEIIYEDDESSYVEKITSQWLIFTDQNYAIHLNLN